MKMKETEDYVASLDIGTDKMAMALGMKDEGLCRLVGVESVGSEGIGRGWIENGDRARSQVRCLLERFKDEYGFDIDCLNVALPGKLLRRVVKTETDQYRRPQVIAAKDLNALEQALRLKDAHPGSTVTVLTMGPGRAAEIIREGLYRGADNGYLLTDRAFAGADTLATSYALATAIRKIGDYDLIVGGRQAIDGDTAQVGPQVAEKLGLPQVTYAEEVLNVDESARRITVKRHIDGGVETVEAPLPVVLTVNGSAAPCRPRNAKLVMKYKYALGKQERPAEVAHAELYEKRPYLNIQEWSVADVEGDLSQCGLAGSPTKVKAIQNIVFQAKESKTLSGSDADVEGLMVELLANHTIG